VEHIGTDVVTGDEAPAPPLRRNFDEESSEGETRTLNLAVHLEQDAEQHQLE
jgi:hypothetical protein